jgi:hypothetical protein
MPKSHLPKRLRRLQPLPHGKVQPNPYRADKVHFSAKPLETDFASLFPLRRTSVDMTVNRMPCSTSKLVVKRLCRYNQRVMKPLPVKLSSALRRHTSTFAFVLLFGQFLSCYSPAMSHYRKAQDAEQKLDNVTAEKEYQLALEESPDDPAVVFAMANLYVRMEKQDLAIEKFTRFLELTAAKEADWSKERWDANFYIEKANQQNTDDKSKKKKKHTDE